MTGIEAIQAVQKHGSVTAAATALDVPRKTLSDRYHKAMEDATKGKRRVTQTASTINIDYIGTEISTPEELIADAEIDLAVWEVDRITVNNWEVAGRRKGGQAAVDVDKKKALAWQPDSLWKTPLRQIKISFRRISNECRAIADLLTLLETAAPKVAKLKRAKPADGEPRRCLEISIMDPHLGLQCFPPAADAAWDVEMCERVAMQAVENLLKLSKPYAPVEQIVFPFGNDYLHVDTLFHTTTAGTGQPEAVAFHHIYRRGIELAVAMVDRMKQVAPVKVLQIPGNHDRQTSYTLGCVLEAYYRNDENVEVDASSSPYKFFRYGKTLLGFEHGHSIQPIRLAAIMANEVADDWAATTYREWHLGDQHRKGSGKPSTLAEQGVGVEYLPSITTANEWHRLKGLNHGQRGACAFIYDFDGGPVARLQVNL